MNFYKLQVNFKVTLCYFDEGSAANDPNLYPITQLHPCWSVFPFLKIAAGQTSLLNASVKHAFAGHQRHKMVEEGLQFEFQITDAKKTVEKSTAG